MLVRRASPPNESWCRSPHLGTVWNRWLLYRNCPVYLGFNFSEDTRNNNMNSKIITLPRNRSSKETPEVCTSTIMAIISSSIFCYGIMMIFCDATFGSFSKELYWTNDRRSRWTSWNHNNEHLSSQTFLKARWWCVSDVYRQTNRANSTLLRYVLQIIERLFFANEPARAFHVGFPIIQKTFIGESKKTIDSYFITSAHSFWPLDPNHQILRILSTTRSTSLRSFWSSPHRFIT